MTTPHFVMPQWSAPSQVKAVTSTRRGGFSVQPFNGLNLAQHVDDQAESVIQNRQLLANELALPTTVRWLNQQHTTFIETDDKRYHNEPCDGGFSRRPDTVCVVMTADCMPVFITDRQGSEVAVIHAGWRGLADGIVERAINLFQAPAEQLLAWAGPTISQANFEIGAEVKLALGGADRHYLPNRSKPKHYFADLYALAGERLANLGVTYGHSDACTYRDADDYFSYRRDGVTGRMASLIWLDTP